MVEIKFVTVLLVVNRLATVPVPVTKNDVLVCVVLNKLVILARLAYKLPLTPRPPAKTRAPDPVLLLNVVLAI